LHQLLQQAPGGAALLRWQQETSLFASFAGLKPETLARCLQAVAPCDV
jgi:hypothetical protein